jgi:AraC-like DNA-binding protein/mannose-6-phosphate isomerase-like protein (cupin superfamily)
MRQELLHQLQQITPEERAILENGGDIQQELYTSRQEFVIDSRKLLEKGRLIEIRPHTRFAHFPCHRHNYVELVYMCSGSTTHIVDHTREVVLQEGDLLFLSQNAYHEILPAGKEDVAVNFIILPEFFQRPISMIERENILRDFLLSAISGETELSNYLHISAKGIIPVEDLMESMIWTILQRRSGTNTMIQTSMGLLFMNLSAFAENINRGASGQDELVFHALQYIESHYIAGTLEELSAQLRLPTYQVSRLLKKHTGCNFKELLGKRKLQQAAYLLSNTTQSVESVMTAIGYDNSSFFYRRFRERYGCSPRDFRRDTIAGSEIGISG